MNGRCILSGFVALVMVLSILVAVPVAVAEQTGPDTPYAGGAWSISNGHNVIRNETVELTGDISITDYSSLTFENCTIILNLTAENYIDINVDATSAFHIYDSTIVDNDVENSNTADYGMYVYSVGASHEIVNVVIDEAIVQFEIDNPLLEVLVQDVDMTWTNDLETSRMMWIQFMKVYSGTTVIIEDVDSVGYDELFQIADTSIVSMSGVHMIGDPLQFYNNWLAEFDNVDLVGINDITTIDINSPLYFEDCAVVGIDSVSSDSGKPFPPSLWLESVVTVSDGSATDEVITIENVTANYMDGGILSMRSSSTSGDSNIVIKNTAIFNADTGIDIRTDHIGWEVEIEVYDTSFNDVNQSVHFWKQVTDYGTADIAFYDCGINASTLNITVPTNWGDVSIYNTVIIDALANGLPVNDGTYQMYGDIDDRFTYDYSVDPEQVLLYQYAWDASINKYNYTIDFYYRGNVIEGETFEVDTPVTVEFDFDVPVILTDLPLTMNPGEYNMTITGATEFDYLMWEYYGDEAPALPERTGEFEGNDTYYRPSLNATYALSTPLIDGVIENGEWEDAEMTGWYYYPFPPHPNGSIYIYAKAIDSGLYLMVDVTADNTTEFGDYFVIQWDIDQSGDWQEGDDLLYVAGDIGEIESGWQYSDEAVFGMKGFDATPNSPVDHVFWEVFVPFDDFHGMELGQTYNLSMFGYGTLAPEYTYPNWQFLEGFDWVELMYGEYDGPHSYDVVEEFANWTTLTLMEAPEASPDNIEYNFTEPGDYYTGIRAVDENGTTYVFKTVTVDPYEPETTYEGETNISAEGAENELGFTIVMDVGDDVSYIIINVSETSEFFGWLINLTVYNELGEIVFQGEFYDEITLLFPDHSEYTFDFDLTPPPNYSVPAGTTDILLGSITFTPYAPDGTAGDPLEFAVSLTVEEQADWLAENWLYVFGVLMVCVVIIGLLLWRRKSRFQGNQMFNQGNGGVPPGHSVTPPQDKFAGGISRRGSDIVLIGEPGLQGRPSYTGEHMEHMEETKARVTKNHGGGIIIDPIDPFPDPIELE